MVTTHRDNNSFRLLVLLHTSNNPLVRVIYLFMKTCPTQLLLAPGRLVEGSQADLVRTVMRKRQGAVPSRGVAVSRSRHLGLWGALPYPWPVGTELNKCFE